MLSEPSNPTNVHPMVTRSNDGTRHPKVLVTTRHPLPTALLTNSIPTRPTCFSQASMHTEWRDAMAAEFTALIKDGTWSLVPHQPHQNVVGCPWIYKVKHKANRTIERFKAHLVDKGFHLQEGIDYSETLSPVVKPTTI